MLDICRIELPAMAGYIKADSKTTSETNPKFSFVTDKQAATEAEMHQSIQHINDEISCSTKIEEFNPFRL